MNTVSFEPRNPDFEAQVRASFARQAFMSHIGAELVTVTPGECEVHIAHRPEITQQHGYVHGGAVGAIVDSAMGYAGYSLAAAGSSVLTVEYKLNLIAPGDGERLVARGRVIRPGRTLTICRGDVYAVKDGAETHCASAMQTLMILADRSDGPA
jgi:uncharacterized protein (TIGR00369 family)